MTMLVLILNGIKSDYGLIIYKGKNKER